MFSDSNTFRLNTDTVKYDLTQPAQLNIPFVFDVKNREVIVLDYNNRMSMGSIAISYMDDIKKLISAVNDKQYITIGELANMLSGDDYYGTSLSIVNNVSGENEINPENLFSLFSR